MDWHIRGEEQNPSKRYNPLRHWRFYDNDRKMNEYISRQLNKTYEDWRSTSSKPKSVISLAIDDFMKGKKSTGTLDTIFRTWAITQIREFLFVGHDSTASTIVYCLYLLSKDQAALDSIHTENKSVFGLDFRTAA